MGVRPHAPASKCYGLEVGPLHINVAPLVLRKWSNALRNQT